MVPPGKAGKSLLERMYKTEDGLTCNFAQSRINNFLSANLCETEFPFQCENTSGDLIKVSAPSEDGNEPLGDLVNDLM